MSMPADEPNDSAPRRATGQPCREWEPGEEEAQRQAAWAEYFQRHPEVLASWAHQNGYWPPSATNGGV